MDYTMIQSAQSLLEKNWTEISTIVLALATIVLALASLALVWVNYRLVSVAEGALKQVKIQSETMTAYANTMREQKQIVLEKEMDRIEKPLITRERKKVTPW